ncbi:helix-turn-helix domain-containing protein [Corynebacterium heidelbergense]|uniref:Helix-turn-helix domain-containing protein n=1 Tax=Corynebacterium heidelbergense TaxID=2055947 RepID=A0A364VE21_9CORY|nr:helix-turn-helix domain-containing protein [Corynebacterium heidelbergense]RAV34890.1 hypothetical protein CWC39_00695 [Corynebacterium heidelbergense]WCZ36026.1 hypothetical protein CHEID_02295 [Corynebacterium heidelbergense]
MSLRAMLWALDEAPVDSQGQLVTLIALADHASDNGTGAWPSQASIAERARCSPRTVRRYLNELEQSGLIRRGDQQHVAHLRKDVRPVVWDLCLEARKGRADNLTGRSFGAERADNSCTTGGHFVHDGRSSRALPPDTGVLQTIHNPPEPSRNHPEPHSGGFDEFWRVYPRRTGKKKAREAWDKAVTDTDPSVIIDGARRYAQHIEAEQTEQRFIKWPQGWLNDKRWEDDLVPSKPAPQSKADAWLALADGNCQAEFVDGEVVEVE